MEWRGEKNENMLVLGDTKTQESMAMMSLAPSQKGELGTLHTGFFGPVEIIVIAVGEIIYGKDLEQRRQGANGGQLDIL